MPSTRDLRRRIKSVKNTSQITKAMQMVSATKMRKTQTQAISARPYSQSLILAVVNVSGKIDSEAHPLLADNGCSKTGTLVISTDKGLCGALNTNIIRVLANRPKSDGEEVFYTVGKKVRDYIVRTGKNLEADFENPEKINFAEATKIRKFIVQAFLKGEVGKVYLIYPHFLSTLRQEPRWLQLLPIDPAAMISEIEKSQSTMAETASSEVQVGNSQFLFEPTPDQVLDYTLLHLMDTRIYQAMLETKASEHSARMIAMQNATDNAKELVGDLTLTYNQMRQGAITTELLEITSAAAALE